MKEHEVSDADRSSANHYAIAPSRDQAAMVLNVISVLLVTTALFLFCGRVAAEGDEYRFVGNYQLYDSNHGVLSYGLKGTLSGFIVREQENVFVFRDWETQQEQWRVTSARPDMAGWVYSLPFVPDYSWLAEASPDGHVLAVMTAAGSQAMIQTWRDGKDLGKVLIPMPRLPKQAPGEQEDVKVYTGLSKVMLTVTPGGRCFFTVNYDPFPNKVGFKTYTAVIEGNRVIASDLRDGDVTYSTDGSTVAYYRLAAKEGVIRKLARIVIHDGDINFNNTITTHWDDQVFPAADGIAMGSWGKIYRVSRKHTDFGEGWNSGVMSSDGHFGVISQSRRMRLVTLATGEYWEAIVPDTNWTGDLTEDGQNLIVCYEESQDDAEKDAKQYIAVYHRPGHLLATLQVDQYDWSTYCLSPDGRFIALAVDEKGCMLFRY